MDIKEFLADAMLTAIANEFNDGGGSALIEIHSAAFAAKLCEFTLGASPFGAPGAGAAGYRQINVSGLPLTTTGLAAAGAGTTAAKYRALSETGDVIGEGNVTATGGGGEVTLSNVSIAQNQEVNLTGFGVRFAAALGA